MGHFDFFQIIKNYAETILLIDKKMISQEAPYAAQQSLTKGYISKNLRKLFKIYFKTEFGFYIVKITFIDYQVKLFSLLVVFGDSTLL